MYQSVLSHPTVPSTGQSIQDDELFDERTEKIIRVTAWRLVRSGLFQPHEEDDIKQDLRLSLWQQMPKFNPALSKRYTFATMVCRHTAKNIRKSRIRMLNKDSLPVSLDEVLNDGDCTRGDCISSEAYQLGLGRQNRTDAQMQALKERAAMFLERLPEEDRAICRQLMEGNSLRSIARTLDCPFTTLRNHFRQHIAPKFPGAEEDAK